MGKTFFVDWELWQQMSFALAVMIIIVMCAGVVRLQFLNWKSKRIMLEDEEKRSRLGQIKSAGLRARRHNDIPFGVRAIESGIEVDGIWISRPGTPTTPTPMAQSQNPSQLTLTIEEPQSNKGKERNTESPDLIESWPASPSPLSANDHRPRHPSQLRHSDGTTVSAYSVPSSEPETYQQRTPSPSQLPPSAWNHNGPNAPSSRDQLT